MSRIAALLAFVLLSACASAPQALPGGRTLKTAGGDIYVKEWGNPAGNPVLMIHGTTSHLEEFVVSLGPMLAPDYRLIAYDRPGMGRSTRRPPNAEKLSVQAQTAADVIKQLKLDRPVIVAHSYGGAVGLRLGLDHPELVSGLVLLSPASHPWGGGAPIFYTLQAAPVVGEIATTLSWPFSKGIATSSLRSRVFAPQPMPDDYFETAGVKLALRPAQMRASSKDFAALPAELELQAPRYGELNMPIAIIAGRDDNVIPASLMEKANASRRPFANSHFTLLPGVGHAPQHARPDLVKNEIAWVFHEAGR
jgi:pimeloyl-ACP methyl ester carboxylesterase